MQNTVAAKAKLVKNAKLKTLRLVVAFNVYEKTSKGEFKFPSAKNCAYISGDLTVEDVPNAVAVASRAISADIQLV